jgi:hypothetical protein
MERQRQRLATANEVAENAGHRLEMVILDRIGEHSAACYPPKFVRTRISAPREKFGADFFGALGNRPPRLPN